MGYEVGSDDLQRLGIPWIVYHDLAKFNSIEAVFDYYGGDEVALLFETHPNEGHWTMLSKKGGSIKFFDSYGLGPDSELEYVGKYGNRDGAQLNRLLKNEQVHHLSEDLQSFGPYVDTCGRYVVLRALDLRKRPDWDLHDWMKHYGFSARGALSGKNDEIIVKVTKPIIGR